MFLTNSYAVFSLFHVSYIYCAQYRTPNMKIEKLIERVKAGDTDALKTVYQAYSQRMRNACIKITQEDEDTVDDLVQESFIRAYYSLEKLKDASKFGEWLVAITKNVSLRYLERKRKIQVLSFSEIGDGFDVESSYTSDSKLEEKELFELIDKLPSGYRNVFRMAVIDGFSHKEIAEKLGIEPHSSSSQLTRAKGLLRNMINRRMLTVISILLVSIPIYKYLFCKRGTEKKQQPVANINDAAKGKRSVDRVTVQPTTQSPVVDKNIIATASPSKMKLPDYIVVDSVGIQTDYKTDHKTDFETGYEKTDSAINIVVAIDKDSASLDTIKQVVPELEKFIAKEVTPSYKSKWQLLAMGSVGSALAQSAYKILVGKGEDIADGPQPSGPQMFSTWEQYSQYLQQNAHGNMSESEKALMEIAIAMGACSTEQNIMEQVRMSDVVNSGCISSFSATESRPEYYKAEKEKSAKMSVSVDARNVAHFQVTDLQANCAVNGFSPQVHAQDGEIRIVLIPLGDSTIEADCMCNYNVSFNLSNLVSGTYHVMVYRSDFSGKYDSAKPCYEGNMSFVPNKNMEIELK